MKRTFALSLLLHGLLAAAPPESPVPPLAADDIDYKIIRRQVKTIDAEEPAPLPGMTPVRKNITVTVDEVADPHLSKPPPPPAAAPSAPEALAAFRAKMALRPKPVFIHLSATVYDHENTLLRWFPNGRPDQEMIAWSNIDWSLLAGQSRFVIEGREYHLLLGIGQESTENRRRLVARVGLPYTPPVIPALPPDETPAFIVTKGDASDAAAIGPITALHNLFATDATRLQAEYAAREAARIEREAYLRAHPPEPQDIHIRVWDVEQETPATK